MRQLFIAFGFLLFLDCLTAQTFSFPYRRYDMDQGLPSSDVFSMTRDDKGFLWFATDNGLSQFDGFKFNNYFTEQGLADNLTVAVEHLKDTIFVSCYRKGIQKFYNNHFDTTIQIDKRLNYIQGHPNQLIFGITTPDLNNSYMYFKYHNGVYVPIAHGNPEKNLFFPSPRSTPNPYYYLDGQNIYKDNNLWRTLPKQMSKDTITCIDENTEGGMLLGGIGTYFILNRDNTFTRRKIPELQGIRLFRIFKDQSNRVWLRGNTGDAFVDFDGQIHDVKTLLNLEKTVKIRHIYYDETANNIWVLTNNNGVYCIFNSFITNYDISRISNNTISRMLFDDSHKLWIGTSGYLVMHEKGVFEAVKMPHEAKIFNNLQKIEGKIFVSPASYKDVYDINNIILTVHGTEIHPFLHLPFLELGNGNLLTSYGDTLVKKGNLYKRDTNRYTLTKLKGLFGNGTNRVNALLKAKNDTIWVGNYKGLFWLKDNIMGKVAPQSAVLSSIVNGSHKDAQGRIYILTEKGFAIYDQDKWVFDGDTYQGRDVKKSRSLTFDNVDRLWLGTANGLLVFDKEKSYFFDKSNGLVNSKVNDVVFDSVENCMWISTNNGLSKIDLAAFERYRFEKPKPQINLLSSFDGKKYPVSGSIGHDITISSNNVIVHISALDYQNPKSILYEYQLDKSPWTTTDSTLTLPSISYGNHTLIVRSKIENSDWAITEPLTFYVKPPFYLTWWFILACELAFLYVVYWRIQRLKKQNTERLNYQSQITELKQKGLASMMNPHFIFNSLNSIQYFVNSNNLWQANEYLSQFGKLIRYNLEASMKGTIPLDDEIKRLELYLSLEKMRFNFNYEIEIEPNINVLKAQIPSMIIQPFIENAIWHGILPSERKGNLKVKFTKTNDTQLLITIEDNGIGIEQSKKMKQSNHIARSLQIIQERIELLNKTHKGLTNKVSFEELVQTDGSVGGTRVGLVVNFFENIGVS
jgi:ligand-binding sensor domain-containing protein